LYYTASSIIKHVDGRPVHRLRADCSKHVQAYTKLIIKEDFVH